MPGVSGAGSLAGDTIFYDNGATLDWSLITAYGIGMRAEKQDDALLRDINADDGNRNFDRGSLVTHRVSALGEMIVRKDNYGAVVRASVFYDDAYHGKNDHDAPERVNKFGDYNEFTSGTEYYAGERARFLDAYVFSGWRFDNGQSLDVNAGRHVVAWGESLFYPGVSGAQSPADAVKGSLPGVEVKEIILPVGQVSALWNVNPYFSLGGYVQYEWKGTELPPVGSYLSTSDIIGPGRDFLIVGIPLGPLVRSTSACSMPARTSPVTAVSGACRCATGRTSTGSCRPSTSATTTRARPASPPTTAWWKSRRG